jgi:hypothetical protein
MVLSEMTQVFSKARELLANFVELSLLRELRAIFSIYLAAVIAGANMGLSAVALPDIVRSG